MNYITTSKNLPNTRSTRVETTKSEQYLQAQNSKNRNRNNSQPMPKMVNGLSHQACKLKGRVGYFSFNHMKASDLILSTTWRIELCLPLNNLLFLSFQISHVVANQLTWRIAPRAFTVPSSKENWLKWSITPRGRAVEKPNHLNKYCHTESNVEQCRNKWVVVFNIIYYFMNS